jgi:hypothetical protein
VNGKPLTDDDGAGDVACSSAFFSWGFGSDHVFLGSNNILYPKEDREQKVLLYACRNCDHQVLPSLSVSSSLQTVILLSFFFDSFGSLSGIWSKIQMGRAAAIGRFRSRLMCTIEMKRIYLQFEALS